MPPVKPRLPYSSSLPRHLAGPRRPAEHPCRTLHREADSFSAGLAGHHVARLTRSRSDVRPRSSPHLGDCWHLAPLPQPSLWHRLPRELLEKIAALLPPNEVAGTLRLVSKGAAEVLTGACNRTVRLSQPVPQHALLAHFARPDVLHPLSLRQRQQLVAAVARNGSPENLQALSRLLSIPLTTNALCAAASASCLDTCAWLVAQGVPWVGRCDKAEAEHHAHSTHSTQHALDAAASSGSLRMVQWALDAGCPWSPTAAGAAAREGHAVVMQHLVRAAGGEGRELDAAAVLQGAAEGLALCHLRGLHLQLVAGEEERRRAAHEGRAAGLGPGQHEAHVPGQGGAGADALGGGEWQVQAQGQGHAWWQAAPTHTWPGADEVVAAAAGSCSPCWRDKVGWLLRAGYPRTARVYARALGLPDAADRLPVLRVLGLPLRAARLGVCTAVNALAANPGCVQQLEQLLDEGQHADWATASCAAAAGNLEALRVLRARRCPVPPYAVLDAAEHGHEHVVSYLVDELGGRSAMTEEVLRAAVAGGSVPLVRWLLGSGCPMGAGAWGAAVVGGSSEMRRVLAEAGCPRE